MVDVEHGALCAFGKYILALGKCLVDFKLGVAQGELAHVAYALHPLSLLLGDVVVGEVEVAQDLLVACLECLVLLLEVVLDVANAQTDTAGLVAICGANALTGGANLVLALGGLVGAVEHTVCGQDEVCAAADVQTALEVVAGAFQFHGLGHEEVGGNDTTVADDVQLALVEDARGDAAEHELLAFEDDGVSGIGTTGKSCHNVVAWGEYVYNLTFSFVAEDDA